MAAAKQTVTVQELIEKGFLQPTKRGRPSLYSTDEERKAVHRAQQRACVKRHTERVKQAKQLMMEASKTEAWDGLPLADVVPVDKCG